MTVSAAAARDAAIPRRKRARAACEPPHASDRPAHPRRFFFVSPRFSRCEKIFCLVKNHAAWHNRADCRIKKGVSHRETSIINK
ncbi:hypothetical protein DN556_15990 [Burkholderia multivorans]|nr:hypothetical protein DN556_15990 [Burkholderia multivorans]